MASSFVRRPSASITSYISGGKNKITVNGTSNTDTVTPEVAQTQLNRLLFVVNVSVVTDGMVRNSVEEATAQ